MLPSTDICGYHWEGTNQETLTICSCFLLSRVPCFRKQACHPTAQTMNVWCYLLPTPEWDVAIPVTCRLGLNLTYHLSNPNTLNCHCIWRTTKYWGVSPRNINFHLNLSAISVPLLSWYIKMKDEAPSYLHHYSYTYMHMLTVCTHKHIYAH